MKRHVKGILFIALVCNLVSAAGATHELSFIGEWGTGGYQDVFVQANYAFCAASRAGLDVIDITIPESPTRVANEPLDHDALGVHVADGYAFVATGRQNVGSRLEILNITSPLNPLPVASFDPAGGSYTGAVFVSGSYVYLSFSGGGIDIVDVSDPTAPSFASGFRGVSDVRDIFVAGDYAYLATRGNGLWIVDVSDPHAPSPEGIFPSSGWLEAVWVQGVYAYVAAWQSGLIVVDVSDPSSPVEEGRSNLGVTAREVFVSGSYAYVGGGGLHIVDVSDPSSPDPVASETEGVDYFEGGVVGTKVVLGDRIWGTFQVFEVSNPAAPMRLGSLPCPEQVHDVSVSGDHAYVGTYHGLAVLDIADRSAPTLVALYPSDSIRYRVSQVVVRGNYVYLTVWTTSAPPFRFEILDISDPSSPTLVGFYGLDDLIWDLFLQGDYAYLGQETYGSPINDGFLILDISNPAFPWLAGSYGSEMDGWSISVQGEYASVDLNGLRVLDVDPPWDVTEVTHVGGDGNLDVEGSILYRCKWWPTNSPEFEVFDVSAPTSPSQVGSVSFPCKRQSAVSVSAGWAYVSGKYLDGYHSALQLLDVSDASMPTPVATYPTYGDAEQVYLDNEYVFIADGYTGKLLIYLLVDAIFADGFESGDVSAWSASVP